MVERLTPIRARTLELLEDPAELDRLLAIGAEKASERAERMLRTAYDRVGFIHALRCYAHDLCDDRVVAHHDRGK